MNNTKAYDRGTVIFREGDPGDCMYELNYGGIGVYHDYGGPDEKLIVKLYNSEKSVNVFGEMGLLEHAPRSATAVVLEKDTVLTRISEEDFNEYFAKDPVKMLELVQQMCNRLRATTQDYIKACHTVYDTLEESKNSKPTSTLAERLDALCDFFTAYHPFF